MVSIIVYNHNESNQGKFQPLDLEENVGYQLCTASINSKIWLCDYPEKYAVLLYNISEERMNKLLLECPDGTISDTEECIGNRIRITNPKSLTQAEQSSVS